ncbi:unnamed protein product [Nippostrongylus brasiliensis]|uniref:Uncharacterized protein n=1 Tax=Nippostrongylus brasiliensis TaxID=27835 RepID=A0A0N4XCD7_NIPBR|nr:unnamed protein product [Nippostrongylus brasiliensis]
MPDETMEVKFNENEAAHQVSTRKESAEERMTRVCILREMQNRICELLSDSRMGKERKLETEKVMIEAISQAEEAWTAPQWERVMSPDLFKEVKKK